MLKLSTSASATVPCSVWVRPDLSEGKPDDGVSTELILNVRVVRAKDAADYKAQAAAAPHEMFPKFVPSVENLVLDDVAVHEVTPDLAKWLPIWILNRSVAEFNRVNSFSEEEAGN